MATGEARHRHRVLVVITVILAIAACLLPRQAWAAGDSRAIGVVFDNSGSMLYEGSDDNVTGASDKWCNARYGLEAVAGMMGSGDNMTVYCMDADAPKLSVSGDGTTAEQRVQAVHNADLGISFHTEAYTVRHALDSLEGSDASERYLFITTDGAFDSVGYADDASAPDKVSSYIQEAADRGITVIYLAIGENATTIDSDPGRGIYAWQADSSSILSTMTDIANQMFNRATVPHDDYDVDAGTIRLEIPMGRIVVFAQGESVSVGALAGAGGTSVTPDIATMSYLDTPSASGADNVRSILEHNNIELDVNQDLHGQIAVYDAQLASGDYSLDISGAQSTEIYYEPYADVAVSLTDPLGQTTSLDSGSTNELMATTYTASLRLLDPFTHEEISSPLVGTPSYSLQVHNADTDQTVAAGDEFELSYDPSGQTTITATATLTDGVEATQTYSANVASELGVLNLDTSGIPASVSFDALDGAGGTVHVTHEDGSELTADEWANTTLEATNDAGLPVTVEKSDSVGDFTVTVGYLDGDGDATYESLGFGPASILAFLPGLGTYFERSTTTTLTAQVNDDAAPFGGRVQAPLGIRPSLGAVLLRWSWLYILIIALVCLIVRIIRKPRLPRGLRAYLVDGDGARIDLECFTKTYFLHADRMTFSFTQIKSSGTTRSIRKDIGWKGSDALGIDAVRGRGGGRSFRLDSQSLQALQANKVADPGNMTNGGGFKFDGKVRPHVKRVGLTDDETYTIRFSTNG